MAVLYDSAVRNPIKLANVFFTPILVPFFFPFFQTERHVHSWCYTAVWLYCAIHFWAGIYTCLLIWPSCPYRALCG